MKKLAPHGARTGVQPFVWMLMALIATSPTRAEQLPLKGYTTADGLPHNVINKIVRDSRGFLWFCTDEGLSRFDGYQFTNFGVAEGLPDQAVTDFVETRAGEFWVGTRSGLVRFNPTGIPTAQPVYARDASPMSRPMFTVFVPDSENRRARAISAIREGHDGSLWIGTASGVYRLERTDAGPRLLEVDVVRPGRAFEVLDLLEDRHGSLWIGSFQGLCRRWPDGTGACYGKNDGVPDQNVHAVFEDHEGRLWAGTRLAGFFRFHADQSHRAPVFERTYGAPDGLGTAWVSDLFETSDRRFWIATNRGLAQFFPDAAPDQPSFKTYTQRNGLLYYGVSTLAEDASGNLWFGSDVGAMKLSREGFLSYGEQDGILSVFAIFGDRAGEVCFRAALFGDDHTSVFEGAKYNLAHPPDHYYSRYGCVDGQSFKWFLPDALDDTKLGWVGEMITAQTRSGEWWLGSGAGIYRFPRAERFADIKRARPLAIYSTHTGLKGPQVYRLFEDSRGGIWASTILPNGVARWDPGDQAWHDYSAGAGVSSSNDLAQSFGEDRDGNVWIGFAGRAARYRDHRFELFDETAGLPSGGSIQYIYSDRTGRLWLATARGGLIRVDNPGVARPTFTRYTRAQGLSSDSTQVITEDLSGRIYVGTGLGLDRLDPVTGQVTHFTVADGLPPAQILAAFRAADGALWFGTVKGLSRYVPGAPVRRTAPPIVITGVRVAGARHAVSALGDTSVVLPALAADQNNLQIDFVGLDFTPGEELRYQYLLEGSGAGWSGESRQRIVNLASLAPGRYRLLVRALNSESIPSPVPAVVAFAIVPPVWQRWWFLSLAALGFAAGVYAIYRNRIGRLVQFAEMRMRIATDLHDDIGANLTKIAVLSEVVKQQGTGDDSGLRPLSSIARIARESVAAMSDIVWAINPERDTLVHLVRRMRRHAEETFSLHDIELNFTAPIAERDLKLGADVRRDVLLIFKEAINNAVRHSGCSQVRIDFDADSSHLTLCVADNGNGFDPTVDSDGHGLLSMHVRAERLGGTLHLDSRTGCGTVITLNIPLAAGIHLRRWVGDFRRFTR